LRLIISHFYTRAQTRQIRMSRNGPVIMSCRTCYVCSLIQLSVNQTLQRRKIGWWGTANSISGRRRRLGSNGRFCLAAKIWNWHPPFQSAGHSNLLEDGGNKLYCFMCGLIQAFSTLRRSNSRIISPNPDHCVFAGRWPGVQSIHFRGHSLRCLIRFTVRSLVLNQRKKHFKGPNVWTQPE
jgi:hypothetical protein